MIKIANNNTIFVYNRYNLTIQIADIRKQKRVNIYIFYAIDREKEIILGILFKHDEQAVLDIEIKYFH